MKDGTPQVRQGSTGFLPKKAMCMQARPEDHATEDQLQSIMEMLRATDARLRSMERELRWIARPAPGPKPGDAYDAAAMEAALDKPPDHLWAGINLNPLDMRLGVPQLDHVKLPSFMRMPQVGCSLS